MIQEYFDVDISDDERVSKFERTFGSEYIDSGKYEVYDVNKLLNIDAGYIEKMFPFYLNNNIKEFLDIENAKSIFFVETKFVNFTFNDDIKLLGPFFIEKYKYEAD